MRAGSVPLLLPLVRPPSLHVQMSCWPHQGVRRWRRSARLMGEGYWLERWRRPAGAGGAAQERVPEAIHRCCLLWASRGSAGSRAICVQAAGHARVPRCCSCTRFPVAAAAAPDGSRSRGRCDIPPHHTVLRSMVIETSKKFFPQMAVGFSDPRVKVHCGPGALRPVLCRLHCAACACR